MKRKAQMHDIIMRELEYANVLQHMPYFSLKNGHEVYFKVGEEKVMVSFNRREPWFTIIIDSPKSERLKNAKPFTDRDNKRLKYCPLWLWDNYPHQQWLANNRNSSPHVMSNKIYAKFKYAALGHAILMTIALIKHYTHLPTRELF